MNTAARPTNEMTTEQMNRLPLDVLRADYEHNSRRGLTMPLAGLVMWTAVGIASLFLPERLGLLVLVGAMSSIYPLALLIARFTGENMKANRNPLTRLMLCGIVMANLGWVLSLTLLAKAPHLLPMAVGIALGLHWVLYGWIIQHRLGLLHAVGRTVALGATAFVVPPAHALTAACVVVVAAYLLTLPAMLRRSVPGLDEAVSADARPALA